MKKTFVGVVAILVILMSMLLLTGCQKTDGDNMEGNSIIGSWTHSSYVYTFNNDKTGSYAAGSTEMKFTYEDEGNKVKILYNGNTKANEFEYRIEGNKLIIKDSFGNDVEYIKK